MLVTSSDFHLSSFGVLFFFVLLAALESIVCLGEPGVYFLTSTVPNSTNFVHRLKLSLIDDHPLDTVTSSSVSSSVEYDVPGFNADECCGLTSTVLFFFCSIV